MFQTYEDGHAQALADHFHGARADFNAMGATYSFIQGYTATMTQLEALEGPTSARAHEDEGAGR